MALPDGLKKMFGAETRIEAQPEPKLPPQMSEWAATNRTDSVRTLYNEDASNFYADGLSDAQRAGLLVEIAMLDRKRR